MTNGRVTTLVVRVDGDESPEEIVTAPRIPGSITGPSSYRHSNSLIALARACEYEFAGFLLTSTAKPVDFTATG